MPTQHLPTPPAYPETGPVARDTVSHSLEQLEQMRVELLDSIRAIEGQMSNRDRRGPDGQRLDGVAYWQWRSAARHAWLAKQREYTELRRQIAEVKRAHPQAPPPLDEAEGVDLLKQLCKLTRRWVGEGAVIPRPAELQIINRVSARLGKAPLPVDGRPAA